MAKIRSHSLGHFQRFSILLEHHTHAKRVSEGQCDGLVGSVDLISEKLPVTFPSLSRADMKLPPLHRTLEDASQSNRAPTDVLLGVL